MATGLFSTRSKSIRNGLRDEAQAVEAQIAELREEIASLAHLLASDASSGASGIRKKARAVKSQASDAAHLLKDRAEGDFRDVIAAGEEILAELQGRYRDTGKKARKAVHEHPLATLGIAAAAGFLLAALLRR
jgi:ElaB/YqjD/DUF883 family membrane-anchored ribosome-binding protein